MTNKITYTSRKHLVGSYYVTMSNGKVYHIDRRYKNEVGYDGWAVGEVVDGNVDYFDVANTKATAIEWAVNAASHED